MKTIPKRKYIVQSWESELKRPCLPVYKKNGWQAYPQPIEDFQTVTERKIKGRCEAQL